MYYRTGRGQVQVQGKDQHRPKVEYVIGLLWWACRASRGMASISMLELLTFLSSKHLHRQVIDMHKRNNFDFSPLPRQTKITKLRCVPACRHCQSALLRISGDLGKYLIEFDFKCELSIDRLSQLKERPADPVTSWA